MRNEGDEQKIDDPEAPVDDRKEEDTDESPSSAKTRAGSNVPNAADSGGDGTHE